MTKAPPAILPLVLSVLLACDDDRQAGDTVAPDSDDADVTETADATADSDATTADSDATAADSDATTADSDATTADSEVAPDTEPETTSDTADGDGSPQDKCPEEWAEPGGACTSAGTNCKYGEECCCGQCSHSFECTCDGATWACLYTDFCFIPSCGDCDQAQASLAEILYAKPEAFTAVVRLDHDSLAILGYALILGPYASTNEADARSEAQAKTTFGSGTNLSGDAPEDVWLFYQSPGDFGGVGAVSAHTGLAVFGGGIVWDGRGDITYPSLWSPAADLGSGCNASGGPGATRGFDLLGGEALDAAEVAAAIAPVSDTALFAAMWHGGYVFDTVVLRYPRTVGAFDPTSAEWIVLVSGGWLE